MNLKQKIRLYFYIKLLLLMLYVFSGFGIAIGLIMWVWFGIVGLKMAVTSFILLMTFVFWFNKLEDSNKDKFDKLEKE